MLEEYVFEKIYIRHAVDEQPDDEEFTMHIHEQCEIYFYISGSIEYLVEGSSYPLEDSCLIIMRPAEVHKPRITKKERYERYAINFPIKLLENLDPLSRLTDAFLKRPLGKNNMLDATVIDISFVKLLFSQMFTDYKNDYDREIAVKSRLMLLLDLIREAYDNLDKRSAKPRNVAEKVLAYVNNHLFEAITVPELAKHFYLSPAQFNRIFRGATGASPWEYITKKRLTAAKEKIHNGFPATTACESCGFNDYSSFYRAYYKYFGFSPTKS